MIAQRSFLELVDAVCKRPGMWTHRGSFDEVVALFIGYDAACNALEGFREWLVLRKGDGNNLSWSALVLDEVRLRMKVGRLALHSRQSNPRSGGACRRDQ